MNWNTESFGDKLQRLEKWHRFYALFPIYIYRDRRTYWLQYIERRLSNYHSEYRYQWEYRSEGR